MTDGKKTKRREQVEAVEVVCPVCKRTQIAYFPKEEMPRCERCNKRMVVKEILTEGKSY